MFNFMYNKIKCIQFVIHDFLFFLSYKYEDIRTHTLMYKYITVFCIINTSPVAQQSLTYN